ncbi:MAG: DUF21 domain-containing protein [Alphaproteobacteria bacterium]|nr:DUF21 domain-containing protein [Alphaproteobacteria bacterium]
MTFSLSLLALFFLLSAFFSGTETAFTAASRPLLYEMKKNGNKRASLVQKMLKTPEKLLGTLLFGNNVVNIAASSISTAILLELYGQKGVLIATLSVSFFVLIFCETLPKTYALKNPTSMALFLAPVMRGLIFISAPVVLFLNGVVKKSLWLLHLTAVEKQDSKVRIELRGAINLPENLSIEKEQKMMNNILDLSEVTVEQIMVHRSHIISIDVATDPKKLIDFVTKCPYTRIPIFKDKPENIIGILHVKALLRGIQKAHKDLSSFNVQDYMTSPWFILETTPLLTQLYSFRKRKEHFSIVIDEYGMILGIVTLEDILEEIVGDIEDETDSLEKKPLSVQLLKNGSVLASGETTLRDLNRQFNWNLPDEEASTLAGLILYESERIPEEHQTYLFYGFHFQILKKQDNYLKKIKIIPPKK